MDRDTFESEFESDEGSRSERAAWQGFRLHRWQEAVDVRDFIQSNYTPYAGDGTFLCGASDRTNRLWAQVAALMQAERQQGVLAVDTALPSGIAAHPPGYIDRELEQIVGLQTDQPLKRA